MTLRNNKIKAGRAEKGYTQGQIALKLGMSEPTYNLKENGKRQFTENEMITLSILLEKSLDELFLYNLSSHKRNKCI